MLSITLVVLVMLTVLAAMEALAAQRSAICFKESLLNSLFLLSQ